MPGGPDTDSQFRFLIACIRHSTSGKVDFEEVRKECGIVSKGAAAKRYERLMKAHNITTGAIGNGVKKEPQDEEKKKPKPRATTKKRKLETVDEYQDDVDDPVKEEANIKGEVKYEDAIVKPECSKDDLPIATPPPRSASPSQPDPSAVNPERDDDDEVLFVRATEKPSIPDMPLHSVDHHPSHAALPMATINGFQPVNYVANMSFPQQIPPLTPSSPLLPTSSTRVEMRPTNRPTSSSYGFIPATWMFPRDSHGYH